MEVRPIRIDEHDAAGRLVVAERDPTPVPDVPLLAFRLALAVRTRSGE